MKKSFAFTATLILAGSLFAQTAAQPAAPAAAPAAQPAAPAQPASTAPKSAGNTEVGGPNADNIGVERSQSQIQPMTIEKFEDDGAWVGYIPRDDGFIHLRKFEGGPVDKKSEPAEEQAGIKESDKYVLGAKIEHLHRAVTYFEFMPVRPLPIPGITKTISLWVVGRNVKHQLYVIVADHFNNRAKIPMGDLAFTGWKKMTAAVPPSIKQSDPRYNNKQGIYITSLLVETDPAETYGNYYIYFDDLRVLTDLFSENNRDPDDMADSW